jgi:microcystin-dependent protein
VSSTEPEKLILSVAERELATRLSENPMDLFQGKSIGWLEDFIRITVGNGGGSGSGGGNTAVLPVGFSAVIQKDLTAETGEYVYTDSDGGEWLYCNGVAVSQTTYADLYAFYGANAFGTDSGGNFFLPDARGRALFFTGTNAAAELGDSDGVAEASRTAKHSHTNGATITGAPGAGTLAVASHTHPTVVTAAATTTAVDNGLAKAVIDSLVVGSTGATAPAITGAPSAGTLAVGGTIGTGTPVDTPAHLFIGSLLVRF